MTAKDLGITLILSSGLIGSALAGTPVVSKEYKAPEPIVCFTEHEWQFDVFGQYSDGNGPHHAGIFRDHGWGGGVGINYFFTRNLGLGVDAAWLAAKEAPNLAGDTDGTAIHNFSGSLIYRFPIDHLCLAPYVYAGGGYHVDGADWASAHGGVGVEFRVKPQKFGIFMDGRWTYLGDRYGHGDLNFFSTRLGFRFIF